MLPTTPADPEVKRVARLLAGDESNLDEIANDLGTPHWRLPKHINNAIGAIRAHRIRRAFVLELRALRHRARDSIAPGRSG